MQLPTQIQHVSRGQLNVSATSGMFQISAHTRRQMILPQLYKASSWSTTPEKRVILVQGPFDPRFVTHELEEAVTRKNGRKIEKFYVRNPNTESANFTAKNFQDKNWPILPATESAEVEGESDKPV
ncbi:hypothetical protein B0H14DRAFT_3147906 [Mycena olivaceomarginata]|nr:hypothetical protein B0H14DRAFT_3147906 [Mycena olivaceomarginata]